MSEFYKTRSESVDMDLTDGQELLFESVAIRDMDDFLLALDMDGDPLMPNESGVCVYELCLSTHGLSAFVEECLSNGCSPYYINHNFNKAAINYAADSKDPEIIRILLTFPDVMVNNTFCHLTPLNSLAVNASDSNLEDVINCMQCLIAYGASTKIPDNSGMTPVQHLMHNAKLSAPNKAVIMEKFRQFENNKFRSINIERNILLSEPMALSMESDDDVSSLRMKRAKKVVADEPEAFDESEWHNMYLFLNAIKHKDNISFDELLEKGIDFSNNRWNVNPVESALEAGNCYALKKLLNQPNLNMQSVSCPLSRVVRKLSNVSGNYRKCFYMLLKNKDIEINEADATGSTALHYAVLTRNNEAISELLERGAFLGACNNTNTLGIEGISPQLLKECFDNCITGDDENRVSMKYDNLRYRPRYAKHFQKEMCPLAYMTKSEDYRDLLEHPLVISFLQHKWNQLSPIFYINFILFAFFAISVMTHTILKFSTPSSSGGVVTAFRIMSWLAIGYMIARECLQLATLPRQYIRCKANYLEISLIIFAILNCKDMNIDREKQKFIAVVTLLLIALEMFLLCGFLPVLSMSTHMLMLEEVCKSFLKSFLLYSIFLITFSFCFYIIFGTNGADSAAPAKADAAADADGDFNKFSNPFKSIVKTLVMLTGEFDAGEIEFGSVFSYLLFLLFVFLMTIVLYNLLNGLAVSDIQTIMGQAKQNGTICRIDLLTRYEDVIVGHSIHTYFLRLYNAADKSGNFEDCPGKSIILNRETLDLAMEILDEKKMTSKRQQRLRNNENRFNNIENKLAEIFKRLDFKC